MEKYLREKYEESFDAQFDYWLEKVKQNPQETLKQIEAELHVLYGRLGGDIEGRGQVANAGITGTIAGLESIRAECVHLLKK